MNYLFSRWVSFAGFLICFGLLAFAAYLQVHLGLLPCPLCVVQRILIAFIGLFLLITALYTPIEASGKKIHSALVVIFSGLGVLVAARHVWLTLQPAGSVTTCSPTLEYMFKNLSFNQTLKLLLQGSDDCARVTWTFLSLNIPEWTLLFFIGFTIFGLVRYVLAKSERGL